MKWGISQAKRTQDTKVVLVVEWFCEAKEGRFHEVQYGTVELDDKNPSSPDFIPFEQITEQQMLDWVFDKIDKNAVEEKMTHLINEQKTPSLVTELPWQIFAN